MIQDRTPPEPNLTHSPQLVHHQIYMALYQLKNTILDRLHYPTPILYKERTG